ncbi:hypothetical protein FRC02_010870 [Tulasnella sp. 418]|nr:hypothetical protein FRC02_010870 [Tulasnella sp. 418]
MNNTNTDPPLTYGQSTGMVLSVEAGFLSAFAVTILLIAILNITIKRRLVPNGEIPPFFRNQLDYLFSILLFNDLVQSVGYVTIMAWIRDGQVTPGPLCTAQGVFQHVGEVGTSLATLAIAIYTFKSLMFRWSIRHTERPWLMPLVVFGLISLFQLLMTVIPAEGLYDDADEPFYGVAGYWCWITKRYKGERLGLEYVIFWFVALVNIILYIPLCLALRGNLVVDPPINPTWWRICSVTWRSVRYEDTWSLSSDGRFDRYALQMLAYPIVYIILILPSSINRWGSAKATNWPSAMSFFACITLGLSGFVNVILYVTTRPTLLPFHGCCARTGLVDDGDEEQMIQTEVVIQTNPTEDTGARSSQQPSARNSMIVPVIEESGPHPQLPARPNPMLDDDSSAEGVPLPAIPERGYGPNVVET